jgi:glycerol-3-phosphate O-acyltransferase
MADSKPTHAYEPNPLLEILLRRVFKQIQVEEGFAPLVRQLSTQGSVLYVLPNLNWLDFLALDHINKQFGLPPIRFANDLGLWLLNPVGPNSRAGALRNMLMPNQRHNQEDDLRDAIQSGGSAALFLKRPPSVFDAVSRPTFGRGMQEGDDLVRAILRMEKEHERPLILLPLVFVWSKSPDKVGVRPWDYILGPHAWPTPTRAIGQFAYNLRYASLRFTDPIYLRDVLEQNAQLSEEVLVRRMTYMVLRRIARERRAVIGPVAKDPARVREEILRSPRLGTVIADLAGREPGLVLEKTNEARKMLEELAATPNPNVTKAMGVGLRWGFNRIYRGIEYDAADVERVREASKDGALVLLPSHKSHIDYLVLSYFFYERNLPMPLIAAGDNLNFKPLGPIFRRSGAFFIRRSFKGDRLYAAVVDAYIRRVIRDGYPIELFLEGGRSRTGKLLDPKFGMLSMLVDAAQAVPSKKVHFVPVSIGYERVVEADSYQRELSGAEKKKEEATDLISASEVLRSRYGRINLQFGQIMTLADIADELGIASSDTQRPAKRRAIVTRLGNRVMDEINKVTAVTPGSLTALSILSMEQRAFTGARVIEFAERLLVVLNRAGARVTRPTVQSDGTIRGQSIRESLQMFADAELLDVDTVPAVPGGEPTHDDRLYTVVETRRIQLDTSKNIIIHFFVAQALVVSSLDLDADAHARPTDIEAVKARVLWASKLFKHEFRFRADAPFAEIFDDTVAELIACGHLARDGANLTVGSGEAGFSGEEWLGIYRAILATFFEGYCIAAQSLHLLLGAGRQEKDLLKAGLDLGRDLYSRGRVKRREAISKPVLENALRAFAEMGFVRSREGKLELEQPFQSQAALAEVEGAISAYLRGCHDAKP